MSEPIIRDPGLAKIHPEWEAFEKQFPIPPLLGTPQQLRQLKFPIANDPPIGFSIKDIEVPGYQGATNQLRLYTPDDSSEPLPVVIYVHGGGWTAGDLDAEDKVCRTMCNSAGVIVVSVGYRKAPENPFPIGLEDVWQGVLWTAKEEQVFNHIETLGGANDKIIISGLSAGGNIAAVLAQRSQTAGNVTFRGQILRVPLVVHTDALPQDFNFSSYTENANPPILPAAAVTQCLGYYGAPPEDIRISPLLAKDFSGLPPAYIQIAGADPLRDDGFAYAERLQKAGIPVSLSVYAGFPHAFMSFPLPSAAKSDEDLIKAIKWILEI
ncbi:Alpha/Beta hydrolase protein [Fusarium flagelliforme]|uniref:Alpha/Beta hydrolase protein n=1 Tax=Fusarium flagelliforme TaxID=2675880 RepID=UPI001E8DE4AB|nr:Alpha/Beta hydrolase protein [Fusarium flagelliforme]KAH7198933.1 Alpha/Beta hydrolase protein [Fusarium flagelliforme]